MRSITLALVMFCFLPASLFAQRLQIAPAAMTIVEGESGDFTVVLSEEPTANVTVTIVRSDGTDASLNKSVLIFTPSNWSVPQKVTVTVGEDGDFTDDSDRLILIASGEGYGNESGVTVSPETAQLNSVGQTIQLKAVVQDQDGEPITGYPLEWSSSDPSVATVDSTGKITGVSNGTTTVTAALATASGETTILVNDPTVNLSDREILEVLYRATGGDNWTQRDGWLTDAPLDQWYGVEMDEDGQVTALKLRENGLNGIIPVELGGLAHLEILDLYNNRLTGMLPSEIGNLVRLRELDLGNTGLEGEIPKTLGKLVELVQLNFESAYFTGSIPPELGALTELESLNLYNNRLSGTIPIELADLRSLQFFALDENQLSGSIPSMFLQLEELYIFTWGANEGLCLPGTEDFMAWRTVKERDFRGPSCDEADRIILEQLYEDTDGVNWTNSTGWLGDTLLDEWYGVSTDSLGHVTVLDLTNNGLRGKLPKTLGDLNQLSVLRIGDNSLSGRMPSSLTNLTLEEFHYANTGLCIPAGRTFQQWLTMISVRDGIDVECPPSEDRKILSLLYEATGGVNWTQQDGWLTDASIDQWYGVETDEDGRVTALMLRENGLKGIIPVELAGLVHLEILDLHSNGLGGELPPEIGNLVRLRELDLGNTGLEGEIPKTLGKLVELVQLSFESAYFTGSIPPELGALTELESLNLFSNRLSGTIPIELADLRSLQFFALDENQLSGSIPSMFLQLEELFIFNWGANEGLCLPGTEDFMAWRTVKERDFRGPYCNEADRITLEQLYEHIDGANWTNSTGWLGDTPLDEWYGVSMDSLGHVTVLDLTNNGLRGKLPKTLGDLNQLSVLRIGDNSLSGRMPSSLTNLTLEEFHYANTGLCIPAGRTFQQWLTMISVRDGIDVECPPSEDRKILSLLYEATGGVNWTQQDGWLTDASIDQWYGVETDEDGRVTALMLRENGLKGIIPVELAGLVHLEILDLHSNGLGGELPPEIGNLVRLRELDLGNTGLEGEIPKTLGKLVELVQLSFESAYFTGSIPPELGALTELESLNLFSNRLSGTIPIELADLRSLQFFALDENQLSGSIPSMFLQLEELFIFNWGANEGLCLPGTEDFMAWRTVKERDFRGPYCNEADRITLEQLYEHIDGANWTNSTGWLGDTPLDEWYGVSMDSLGHVTVLDLTNNGLRGKLPKTLGDLNQLSVLRIGDNSLSGRMPSSLTNLTLEEFHYANTGLCIPAGRTFQQWLTMISVRDGIDVECPPSEDRKILSLLYEATDGVNWTQQDGWLTDASLDQWYGVETDEDGQVTALMLPENGLKGIIPVELAGLVHLEILDLHSNGLGGELPPEIGNLVRLWKLDLGNSNLQGEIPKTLGKLVELVQLNFEGANFTGSIPPELGALTELEFLNLFNNKLSGRVPVELAGLSSLQYFYLEGNQLSGSISPMFLKLEALEIFYWRVNDGLCAPETEDFIAWRTVKDRGFLGPYCNEADRIVLEGLYKNTDGANWTNSTGWLSDDTALEDWYGVSTDSLGRVTVLELTNNGLRGKLPKTLGDLNQLSILRMGDNPLSGRVTSFLTKLTLEEFRYANTGLCIPAGRTFQQWLATIPVRDRTDVQCPASSDREILSLLYEATGGVNWSKQDGWLTDAPLGAWHGVTVNDLGQVVKLQLFGNNLRGQIPLELGEMVALRLLDLSYNWLEGAIPSSLGEIKTLTELYLESNLLSGPIPAELGNLPLYILHLQDNKLEGAIPSELGNLFRLLDLRISDNQLSGKIPPEFGNLSAVQVIWMYENRLEGEIPPELGRLSSLEILYAGDNNLSGTIPPRLGNLRSIRILTFDENNLSGPIPSSMGNLTTMTGELNLERNNLSGEIPASLGRLQKLRQLKLSHNNLSGSIPPEIGQMRALQWLALSNNPGLTSSIPSTFLDLANLVRFETRGTGLCIAQDSPLAEPTVARRLRLPFCGGLEEHSTAYLSQSIQSAEYPIPLVAGRDALLRVFPISAQSTDASIPPARATLFVDGAEVYTVDIPGQSTPIPTELAHAEASLDRSANTRIPGSVIQPGLEMIIDIDPEGTLDADLEMVRRIPESGRVSVGVQTMPTLELTMVPFVWQTKPDNTAVELIEQMVQDPQGHRLLSETRTLLPVNNIAVRAHRSIVISSNDADHLLDAVSAIRAVEGGTGYWMGAISGEAKGAWGVAWINGWTSYVRLGNVSQPEEALTIAHELGHSMSLYHAPCGVSSVVDRGYPYANAAIGSWGIDSRSGNDILVPLTQSDMMSYCVPAWISEYNFNIAMNHRLDREASAKRVTASVPVLLVWGGTDEVGRPYLNPVFAVNAPPSLPNGDGAHRLVGRAANGDVLFSINFDMKSVADREGQRAGFAFAIPESRDWTDVLTEVELTGPAGSAILDADSNQPILILRERSSGHVRAFLHGESAAGIGLDAAAAGSLVSGTDVEVLFSRGLPQSSRR